MPWPCQISVGSLNSPGSGASNWDVGDSETPVLADSIALTIRPPCTRRTVREEIEESMLSLNPAGGMRLGEVVTAVGCQRGRAGGSRLKTTTVVCCTVGALFKTCYVNIKEG